MKIATVYGIETVSDTAICKICGEEKHIDCFSKMGVNQIDKRCQNCNKERAQWIKEQRKLFGHLDTGFCDCCGEKSNRSLHLDHNHNPLKFRGFLCINCNQGIGKLGDNIKGLNRAIKYLQTEFKGLNVT